MTADALYFFWLFLFFNKYAESSEDQPVCQLCGSVMRTLAAERSVFLVDFSFQWLTLSGLFCNSFRLQS